jgi:hypothetical protein
VLCSCQGLQQGVRLGMPHSARGRALLTVVVFCTGHCTLLLALVFVRPPSTLRGGDAVSRKCCDGCRYQRLRVHSNKVTFLCYLAMAVLQIRLSGITVITVSRSDLRLNHQARSVP